MQDIRKVLIVGCGDIGRRVAKILLHRGNQVWALSHRNESQLSLQDLGINVINADLDNKASLIGIDSIFDFVFYFAPPPSQGITDPRVNNFLENYLNHHPAKKILYISTTGVYGNHNDQWIDESTPTKPDNDRSMRRLDAEQQIKTHANKVEMNYVIVRVAGIYSLEKLPLDRLRSGMKILERKLSSASNRIHADDLCQLCIKAMFESTSGEIFNAADGNPSTMSDYFIQTAKVFNLPKPEEVDWAYANRYFSPTLLSYLHESKKIRNNKINDVLGLTLQYPTLEQGLAQCLQEFNGKSQ